MQSFQPFDSFDPLEAKTEADAEVKLKSLKNQIKGILTIVQALTFQFTYHSYS